MTVPEKMAFYFQKNVHFPELTESSQSQERFQFVAAMKNKLS